MQADRALSVSELNEYARRLLAGDPLMRALRVKGEITGFKRHFSGQLYFSITAEAARVQCVMFRQNALSLDFEPADGQMVVIEGSASLYAATGNYQVYCQAMRREGAGALYQKFEALKKKLSDEGLFDAALKKPLPLLPRRVGLVTSPTGAAIRDMIRILRRRTPAADILVAPCQVQGEGAARDIARALDELTRRGAVDVILCGRGGGSIEDLWAFNEEVVARAIAAAKIPGSPARPRDRLHHRGFWLGRPRGHAVHGGGDGRAGPARTFGSAFPSNPSDGARAGRKNPARTGAARPASGRVPNAASAVARASARGAQAPSRARGHPGGAQVGRRARPASADGARADRAESGRRAVPRLRADPVGRKAHHIGSGR
jgi:hypothetical protein